MCDIQSQQVLTVTKLSAGAHNIFSTRRERTRGSKHTLFDTQTNAFVALHEVVIELLNKA